MDEHPQGPPTVTEAPAAPGHRGHRLRSRVFVALAVPFLMAFAVLAGHRDDCVGRPGTAALDACRASAATLEPWLVLTGAATLVLVCLAVLARATD